MSNRTARLSPCPPRAVAVSLVVGSLVALLLGALADAPAVLLADAGGLSFTDVTAAAGMGSQMTGSHGAFWADVTGDGRPDLFVSYNECRSGLRANRFYRNVDGRRMVDETAARGLYRLTGGTHGAAWADMDNDGDYDLLTGDTYARECPFDDPPGLPNRLYRNDDGLFADRTPPAMLAYRQASTDSPGYTRAIVAPDLDGDGDLDVFAVNGDRGAGELVPDENEFYENLGALQFRQIPSGPLVTTPAGQAATDTDYDGDGDVDVLLADFGGSCPDCGDVAIMRNDGNGVFTKISRQSIGISHRASTGITPADLNNDGLIDVILADHDRNPLRPLGYDRIVSIYLNAGGGTFRFHAEYRYIPGFGIGAADLDNDGDLDLVIPGVKFVALNDGHANFSPGPFYPSPAPDPGCRQSECQRPDPRTVAFADIDDDGDLDSVVTVKFAPFVLVRNDLVGGGHWLKVRLTSPQGQAGAFGAKVQVFRPGTSELLGFREARSGYAYLSQDDPVLHFGLGAHAVVDVLVTYLDGTRVLQRNVAAGQTVRFIGSTVIERPGAPRNLRASVSGSRVDLAWDAPSDGGAPTAYQLEAGDRPGLANLAVMPLTARESFTAWAPNGRYYVRVRARNESGMGPPSDDIEVMVASTCEVPSAPAGLSFSVSGSRVTLAWNPPVGGSAPTSYIVEAGSGEGLADLAQFDTGLPVRSFAADAPPRRYYVRVRAKNACGAGPPSIERVVDVR